MCPTKKDSDSIIDHMANVKSKKDWIRSVSWKYYGYYILLPALTVKGDSRFIRDTERMLSLIFLNVSLYLC